MCSKVCVCVVYVSTLSGPAQGSDLMSRLNTAVIDAGANQDSDHTVMLLQPTDAASQIPTGGLLPHTTLSDDSVLAGAFCISL